ncbi:hypothetical protein OAC86_01055 [bacterium]|nr:hypothetical protein [bacterium]
MSFININNKQTNPTATYSATVIREALLSVETKNTAKVDTLVKSIDRDLTLSEALEFFTAKLSAMNALNIALINEATQKEQDALEDKRTFTTAVDVIKLNESLMADIDILAQEAKDLADFTKTFFKEFGGKIKKTADSIEWVEELYTSSIAEALAINERSITKIQKEYAEVVKDMTKTVTDWKAAEGDVKTQLLEKLRALTARKKELEAELDSAVMGKDRNVELSGAFESVVTEAKIKVTKKDIKDIEDSGNIDIAYKKAIALLMSLTESVVTEAKSIKVTKKEWPYVEFKDGGKTHKVEFDYEDIIDDHGNEGQDQYWLGKDDNGQEWMIDVYASSNGDVEEVHYDTIVKESVVTEGLDKNKPYFDFLVALRDSGATNMFGATPYLQDAFDLSKSEARKILAEWMKSFNEAKTNEATVVMDAMDPGSRILTKLLKKHKVTMEVIDNEGPSGWPEVELTGDKKDLEKVLASEDGWDDAGLAEYIEESNGTHTAKVSIVTEAFSRMPNDVIENELYAATQKLSDYYDWLKAGNDSGKGDTLDNVISLLKKCKRMIKRFNDKEETKGTEYEASALESVVTEARYNKKSLLKKLGDADDATIQTGNGKEYIIYNPDSNNDDNAAMWNDNSVFAVDQDGEEHEIAYKDIGLVMVESIVTEKFKFSKKEVEAAANLIASAISQADMVKAKVHDLEYVKGKGAGFEISIDGEKYDGGSYVVKDNGDVVNAAIGNSHPNAVYNTIGNKDIADVFINMEKYESVTEGKDATFTFEAEETPSWGNLINNINHKLNEDLRRDLKKYIDKNEDEINKLADEDAFETIYNNLRAEFDIVEGTKEDKDMIETFQFVF